MVIKDLLGKVSNADEDDPKVQQLREKLGKLQDKHKEQKGQQQGQEESQQAQEQQSGQQQPAQNQPSSQQPQKQEPLSDDDIEQLAQASEEEMRNAIQSQDPNLKLQEERTHKLVAKQIDELIELSTEMEKRVKKLEKERTKTKRELEQIQKRNDEIEEKMNLIDSRLQKFMGLYEVITNQYNPFHDQDADDASQPDEAPELEQEGSEEERKVAVSDNLTGAEQDVEIQQGRISSENAKKMQKLIADLERDEWEKKDLDSEDEVDEVEVREDETKQELVEELHGMFDGFEDRLKSYLDDSVQEKLHSTLSRLEDVLNEEIEQAVKDQVSDLKETDDIVEGALQELEELGAGEEYAQAEQEVEEEVRSVDEQVKSIPPSLYFRLHDGRVLKSKHDLLLALQTMPDDVFSHHVGEDHNDFADWLELALNDPDGEELRGKSREAMVGVLQEG